MSPALSLQSAGRGLAAPGLSAKRPNLRSMLVAIELAASVVLVAGAGLLVRSFVGLQHVAPGFDPHGVFTFELTMSGRQYASADAVRNAYRRLWEELDRLPGVSAAGGTTSLPLSGFFAWGPITVEGRTLRPGEKFINADQRTVSGRYFETMGIPLRSGRFFDERDAADKPRVAIVDERMAHDLWPGQDPIGKRVRNGDERSTAPWLTVVGVVGRVKQYALDADSRIAFYTPQSQAVGRSLFVVVKGRGDAAGLLPAVKEIVRRIDPDVPVYRARTMDDVIARSLAQRRFAMGLMTLFAATALSLALVGVYGVMSYLVSHSARDLGIRIALGATPFRIQLWVLEQAMMVSAAGTAAGLVAAAVFTQTMRGVMAGLEGVDVRIVAAEGVGLVLAALVASYLPARRATRIDPVQSIHAE